MQLLVQPCQNRPAKFARTSLFAWGLPTPIVAFACIGNVDIQVFSSASGQLYFIRRLQVYLFIIFHVQPISQGVTLLFFFTEKKKRSKKRKEFAFHLYCKIPISPEDITFSINKTPPAGHTGGLSAVTLPFLLLKLGRKVGGGLLSLGKSAVAITAGRRADSPLSLLKSKKEKISHSTCTVRFQYHPKI